MSVRLSGRSARESRSQPEKASLPILTSPSGSSTRESFSQRSKAPAPISVTPAGRTTWTSAWHAAKRRLNTTRVPGRKDTLAGFPARATAQSPA